MDSESDATKLLLAVDFSSRMIESWPFDSSARGRAQVHGARETPDHFSFPAHKKKKEKGRRRQTN